MTGARLDDAYIEDFLDIKDMFQKYLKIMCFEPNLDKSAPFQSGSPTKFELSGRTRPKAGIIHL